MTAGARRRLDIHRQFVPGTAYRLLQRLRLPLLLVLDFAGCHIEILDKAVRARVAAEQVAFRRPVVTKVIIKSLVFSLLPAGPIRQGGPDPCRFLIRLCVKWRPTGSSSKMHPRYLIAAYPLLLTRLFYTFTGSHLNRPDFNRSLMRPLDTSIERTLPFSSDQKLRRRYMIIDRKIPGNMRWGRLLEQLDKLAEDIALDYVHQHEPDARVVTAAVDDIALHVPGDITRDVYLRARINYVGRTSMEVGIRVDQDKEARHSLAACYFTMVARTGEGDEAESLPIPPLNYESAIEKERYQAAIERRRSYRRQVDALEEPPSKEEYRHLRDMHQAQEREEFNGLLAAELVRSTMERMYPDHENVPKKIFGGYVIRRAFELALMHAEEIAPQRPVFVRVNRINFLQPIRIGDKLDFTSRIVYTGNTSISIEINIERTSLDKVTKALSNTCVFTFVNVDEQMEPRPVPDVYPTTYAEDERYLKAYRRHRLQRPEPSPQA